MTPQEAGRLGGKRTAEKYGREYMRTIGQKGFTVAMERFAGNPYILCNFLQKGGKWSKLNGKKIADYR